MWAVGAIGAELARGERLFDGSTVNEIVQEILALFGEPGSLIHLPLYQELLPEGRRVPTGSWPPSWLKAKAVHFIDWLSRLLLVDPAHRGTALDSCEHPFCRAPELEVVPGLNFRQAGQGPVSVVYNELDACLTAWAQADDYWAEIAARLHGKSKRREQCIKDHEVSLDLKYEESGYVGFNKPTCEKCVTLDMSRVLGASRTYTSRA